MIEQPPPNYGWLQACFYFLFAAVAGALGYVLRTMDAGAKVSYPRAVVEALSAGLVGLLAMWICQSFGLSQQWMAVTVGISGWLGATASIQVLQRVVWNKLGLTPGRQDDADPHP